MITITDEDVYEASVDILLFKHYFRYLKSEADITEKILTVILYPVLYALGILGFIFFGWVTRKTRKKKQLKS